MEKSLSEGLRQWLKKNEDFLANPTRSHVLETIDVVEYYELKEAREQARSREPYIDRISETQ